MMDESDSSIHFTLTCELQNYLAHRAHLTLAIVALFSTIDHDVGDMLSSVGVTPPA